MHPRDVTTKADVKAIIEERNASQVKVGVFDIDGVLRGKYMSRSKFLSALEGGFGFCDVVLGWDSNDQLYDNVDYTGWHTAYPDAWVNIIPDSCREIPSEGDTLFFLCEFTGPAESICPRGLLRRVLARADSLGFSALAACEFEFFLFEETPKTVRDKHYQHMNSITPGFFGYSVLRSSVMAEFYNDFMDYCNAMDTPVEGFHTETGPGVLEAALAVDSALNAADKAALFKTFTKVYAQRNGMMATFMAKWSADYPGQSGHMHVSLFNKDGSSAFYDEAGGEHNMSETMRHFIGGQQALMPEFLAMIACTVNSYTRLIPGAWAPTSASWGIENRTCALRAIPGSPKSQRVEYRISAADINPYIALAAALASGLWGIENQIEPDAPIAGTAYDVEFSPERTLPVTLMDAAGRLRASKAARELFGDAFVDHYAATREWEEREFRKAITDWELQRYFEII
ncbi:glutamine synthetase family protein [Saccharospirillum impatiens]|uniref:glutamine synthetase family protein n=1 Tax=Saccharospirillum impatiens TaxID=169438 RepID=UPI000404677F|nr:glutamine synthetase family protein [Saccharospirillum impatiens]